MHILADTWAHRYFAGTPSYVINNTSAEFYELLEKEEGWEERKVRFNHNPATADDPETSYYTNTAPQMQENTIMNLGHGRAGHLPDYSYARYRYMPAWEEYREVIKDNPAEYYFAFAQMIYAMRCLRTEEPFAVDTYDYEAAQPWKAAVSEVLNKRQLDAAPDWRALAEKITGRAPAEFSTERCQAAYLEASEEEKDNTPLGQFILAALAQKSMVTHHVFVSGSLLAGISVDFATKGFRGNA